MHNPLSDRRRPGASKVFLLLVLWGVCCQNPLVAHSAMENPYRRLVLGDPESPWRIQADEVTYHQARKEYQASGHVVIRQEDKTLSADKIIFSMETMMASADGNVVLKFGEDVLTAKRMELDIKNEKGVFYEGEIFLAENHFYLKGDRIEQKERYVYAAENAWLTSCDADDPAWRISGKKLDVTLNGYGYIRHGALWAKKVPVFYTPFFLFPVKLDRQSGLLIPKIGFSRRKGFEFDQPLYWAINDSSDMTLYENYLQKRGNKIGMEYRYALDGRSKGVLMADFLNDLEIDDGTPRSTDNWGYDHDVWDRSNSDRYWVRTKQDQAFDGGFTAKLDLDLVSDQDYLLEFLDGHSGYHASQKYFKDNFGRILDSYEDPTRVSRFNLNKNGSAYSLNADLKWYDNVIARKYLDEDTTLQQLPRVTLSTLKRQISKSPFSWNMNSEYTYFYSEDGTNGHRMDVHPRMYFSRYRNRYFTFEPSAGLDETVWRTDKFQDHPLEHGKDRTAFRHQYDLKLDFASELYKVYPAENNQSRAFRHTLIPRLVYEYVPRTDQEDLPWFESLDDEINRIQKKNSVAFQLTQFVTSRSVNLKDTPKPAPDGSPGVPVPQYHQLLRLDLKQGLDIDEARENGRPVLPLDAEMELICTDFFSIWADAQYSYYENAFLTRNMELKWQDDRGDRFHFSYRFTDDLIESLYTEIGVRLSDVIFVYADNERNLLDTRTLETKVGVLYDAPCWALDVRVKDNADDRRIEFIVNLKGLGEIGTN